MKWSGGKIDTNRQLDGKEKGLKNEKEYETVDGMPVDGIFDRMRRSF